MTKKGPTTRNSILDIAIRLASSAGIGSLSIGKLAKHAKMSKSGVFAHFKSKEKLQIAVLDSVSQRFVSEVLAPAFKAPRGIPRMREIFKSWIGWHNGQDRFGGGCVLIAAASEFDDIKGPIQEHVQKIHRDLIDALEYSAKTGVEEGHFRSNLNCKQFAWSLYSHMLGYHLFSRLLKDPTAEKRLRRSFNIMLRNAQTKRNLNL